MEKHTAYYNLIEQLSEPGCPICHQLRESLKSFLDTYLYEGVTDRGNWNRLVASDGYCARHCGMMEEFSDGLAVALFYSHLYKEHLKKLGEKEKVGLFGSKKKLEPCPACEYETQIQNSQLLLLVQAIEEKEFKKAYETNDGLCLDHARKACMMDGPGAKTLKALSAKRLGMLIKDLDEFVRKSDHRNDEKMGPEGDSWQRALKTFHGIKYQNGKD